MKKLDVEGWLLNLIKNNKDSYEQYRKEKQMEQKEQKKSYICYVYGQIYAAYLKGEKEEYFVVENTKVQTWKRILDWLKREEYIVDYELGDTPDTAGKVVIKDFNENNMIYEKYCAKVLETYEKEREVA